MPERVVVVGGGVGGLASALALARRGHHVTIAERDELPAVDDVEAAFAAERRGAPQVHQTHGFLARIVVTLRERFPDVLDDLLAAGCFTMPATANLGEPQPGDDDLAVLIVRRTTFEWVLRRAVRAEPGITLLTGTGVAGLVAGAPVDGIPTVAGVRLETPPPTGFPGVSDPRGGTTPGKHEDAVLDANVVIVAGGRRTPVPAWLAEIGAACGETVVESGLMYLSRWYRLPPGFEVALDPKLGGDLGYVKYLAVPGDGGTLSVTLAIRADDAPLRQALSDADRFEHACRLLPGPDTFFDGAPLEPVGGVRPMGGLLNRRRRFVDDEGRPTVLGFHAVGDAHTCTNPLYGRGCSLAVLQSALLADAFSAHPEDPAARAVAYERACDREVAPWFDVSVQMDALGADPNGATAGEGPKGLRAIFAAAATDPVIGRAIVRFWNLLATPADLMSDPDLLARIAAVVADPDAHPVEVRAAPTRGELLESLNDDAFFERNLGSAAGFGSKNEEARA